MSAPTARDVARTVFVGMLREEWRLHARLFGGARFGAFPLFVAAVAAGATWLLVATGTEVTSVVAGLHALVFVFGLHTGTIGFVGRDAIRNLLGDVTLLVFTSRTLPTSPRRLVAIFLVKDAAYYAVLFLAPLSVAVVAVATVQAPEAGAGLSRLPLLWLTTTGTFVLGVCATFLLVGLGARRSVVLVGAVALVGATSAGLLGPLLDVGALADFDVVSLTPYAFYRSPGLGTGAAGFLPIPVLAAAGVAVYDPTHRRPSRTSAARFSAWRDRLRDGDGLLTKSLVDVARSSGGFGKVVFSGGVLFLVTAFLVGIVERLTGVAPSTGVSFGALLGLTAFTTYNWLTQFDSPDSYRQLPIPTAAVFRAKFRAFLLLGVPTALGYYALATIWLGGPLVELVAGAVLALGVLLYLFGLTVALAGFEPNEFLFDTVLFAAFAGAVSLGLVPVLVVGFVLAPLGPALLAGVVGWGLVMAATGLVLYRRAVPKWTARYRRDG